VELPGGALAWSITNYNAAKEVLLDDSTFLKEAKKHWPMFINGEIPADWLPFGGVSCPEGFFLCPGAGFRHAGPPRIVSGRQASLRRRVVSRRRAAMRDSAAPPLMRGLLPAAMSRRSLAPHVRDGPSR